MPQIDDIPEKISDDDVLSRLQHGFSEQPPDHLDQQVLHAFRQSLGAPQAYAKKPKGFKAFLLSQLMEAKTLTLRAPAAACGLVISGVLLGLLSGQLTDQQSSNTIKSSTSGELVFRNADQVFENAQNIESNSRLPADEWMAKIKELLNDGQVDKAYQQLQAYREHHGE